MTPRDAIRNAVKNNDAATAGFIADWLTEQRNMSEQEIRAEVERSCTDLHVGVPVLNRWDEMMEKVETLEVEIAAPVERRERKRKSKDERRADILQGKPLLKSRRPMYGSDT